MMKKQPKQNDMNRPRHIKLSKGDIAFNIVNYTVFLLITLACIFPFYYLFINTISSNELVRLGRIQLYPREIHLENYVQVLKIDGIMDALEAVPGKALTLMPLMLVAGDHARNDLAGDGDSWKNRLTQRGFEIHLRLTGLGSMEAVRRRIVEKLRAAVNEKP